MKKFRDLRADEVEARVNTINEKGLTLLLYKDARCDMRILDEAVEPENWQRRHYEQKGNMFCSVGVKCGNEWVWKDDCGTESNTEKEKGEASDSFKRACFNWGIGRELYTAPFVWVAATGKDGKPNYAAEDKNGKATTYDRFTVTYMAVKDGKITALNIENRNKRRTVFTYGSVLPEDAAKGYDPDPPTDSRHPLICDECGGPIGAMKGKEKQYTAQEAADNFGLCAACIKAGK